MSFLDQILKIPKKERKIAFLILIGLNLFISVRYLFQEAPSPNSIQIIQKAEMLPDKIENNKRVKKSKTTFFIPTEKVAKIESNNINYTHNYNDSLDLNNCKKEDLIQLKGIGEVLSTRIIKYRDLLGGFVDLDQLAEVYGLSSETMNSIKKHLYIQKCQLKLDINKSDFKTLVRHPYLDSKSVNAILKYKQIHGDFSSINDLKEIYIISDSIFAKISPYIKISND